MENIGKFALNLKVKLIVTILEIPRYRDYKKVAFYTVQIEGRELDEFSDFRQRMKKELVAPSELVEMLAFITNVGDNWGFRQKDFRDEERAHRFLLPIETHSIANSKYGLRLYCIVLSPEIVVIMNGGLKTEQNVKNCRNCYQHFLLANRVALSLERAMGDKMIELDGFYIEQEHDFLLEV